MDFVKYVRHQWDRVAAWVVVAVGALAILIGWLGLSRTPFVAEQIPYVVSGGIFGLLLVGIGAMLWISADLRDEWRKIDALEEALRRADPDLLSALVDHVGSEGDGSGFNGSDDESKQAEQPSAGKSKRASSRNPKRAGTGAKAR